MFYPQIAKARVINTISNPISIELRYGKHPTFDRFVFDIPQKIDFQIEGNDYYTSIIFPANVYIRSRSIFQYKYNNLVKNEVMPDGRIRFSIPAKEIKSFATPDKIVVDVVPYEPKEPSFVIEEIKVVEDIPPLEKVEEDIAKVDIADREEYIRSFEELQNTIDMTNVAEEEKLDVDIIKNKPSKSKGRSTSLGFSWTERVGAALFKREDFLWIVFDKRKAFNTDEIAETTKGFIDEIMQVPNPTASILKLKLKSKTDASIRKEGLLWIVDLFDQPVEHEISNFSIQTQYESRSNVYLFIPTNQAGDVITTYDPEFGDMLIFATVFDLNLGYKQRYDYPEFSILQSIQGLAIETYTDDLVVTRNNSGLTIKTRNRGLNISPNLELLKQQSTLLEEKEWIKNLTSELPTELINEDFIETVDRLKEEIKNASAEKKDAAKIMLAKYYIIKGLGFEAAKIYNELIALDSPLSKTENFHGQLGVAHFLKGNYELAAKELSYGRLPEFKEGVLWKIISESAISPDKEKNDLLKRYIPVIRDYPTEIRDKIAKVGVISSVSVSDDIAAQDFLNIIENSTSSRNYSAFIDYWNFEIFAIQGYGRNAQIRLIDAAKSSSVKYSALARRKYAILEFKSGKRSIEETISELERLKFAWGETDFKILLLEDLYSIYYSTGDFYNSMVNMNSLYDLYEGEKKEKIKQNMIQLFENIYLYNQEGSLTPTRALALYDDFGWIARESKSYNDIVVSIADRLVALDLIDRAYKILDIEIDRKDLSELERAKIASRLGLINIFRNHEKEAIRIIDENSSKNLPEYIQSHHRLIKAQALVNQAKYDEALAILKNDESRKSIVLQNEIYMTLGKWAKSSECLKKLIQVPEEGQKIDDEQALIVLDWIIALKKAKKETVVVFVRDKFKPYFEGSRYLSTFNMLTAELNPEVVNIKDIDSIINDISHFSKFIKSYNEFLGSNSVVKPELKKTDVQ